MGCNCGKNRPAMGNPALIASGDPTPVSWIVRYPDGSERPVGSTAEADVEVSTHPGATKRPRTGS